MANTKKMTKADYFRQIMANYDITADEKAFIEHELELLAKKNSAEKKPTAVQIANEGIKDAILEGMEDGKKYTITDLMKCIDACAELSNQRVSALVRQMVTDGSVERTEEKRIPNTWFFQALQHNVAFFLRFCRVNKLKRV